VPILVSGDTVETKRAAHRFSAIRLRSINDPYQGSLPTVLLHLDQVQTGHPSPSAHQFRLPFNGLSPSELRRIFETRFASSTRLPKPADVGVKDCSLQKCGACDGRWHVVRVTGSGIKAAGLPSGAAPPWLMWWQVPNRTGTWDPLRGLQKKRGAGAHGWRTGQRDRESRGIGIGEPPGLAATRGPGLSPAYSPSFTPSFTPSYSAAT
jgi:hypothetical protein